MKIINRIKKLGRSKVSSLLYVLLLLMGSGYHYKVNNLKENETSGSLKHTTAILVQELTPNGGALKANNVLIKTENLVRELYQINTFKPLWTIGFSPNLYAIALEDLIVHANAYGLDPNRLHKKEIEHLSDQLNKSKQIEKLLKHRIDYELLMSDACILFVTQISKGILFADTALDNTQNLFVASLPMNINTALHSADFKAEILNHQPYFYEYVQLQKGLEKFLSNIKLSDKKNIIQDNATGVVQVADILIQLGCLNKEYRGNLDEIEKGIKEFQRYHNLKPDGQLTWATKKALSESTLERYRKIALNLERLRQENIDSDNYALINIPSFNLKVVEGNSAKKTFKVMVGKPGSPTPMLSSRIETIVTYPKWYVPKRIGAEEMLYRMKKDSTWHETRGFKIYDRGFKELDYSDINWNDINVSNFNLILQQGAGNGNALGIVKFLFPNPYSVYLHDTPSKRLFSEYTRAYSHGCIRLSNPVSFANYLVEKNNAGINNINGLIQQKKTEAIRLNNPFDIFVRYYTCEADEKGNLYYYADIYGEDERLSKQLFN